MFCILGSCCNPPASDPRTPTGLSPLPACGTWIGVFKVTSGFSASDVAGYIAIVASHNNWSNLSDNTDYIQARRTDPSHIDSRKQEFMYAPPVPEPMFYQLGALLGMGGLGMYRIRFRRKA